MWSNGFIDLKQLLSQFLAGRGWDVEDEVMGVMPCWVCCFADPQDELGCHISKMGGGKMENLNSLFLLNPSVACPFQ